MNCPVCEGTRMREVEKNGILIDICPSCKGVWLDRGELDKLMEEVKEVRQDYNEWYYGDSTKQEAPRAAQPPQQNYQQPQQNYPPQQQNYQQPQQGYPPQQQYSQHGHHGHSQYPKYKKKKSMMDVFGDLFGD
ncbi:TFIIB-type zinc ribbon-containing protein [Cohnella herbarum]|uniref:Zf-TFIIB domain-containing protein n=1 Tax=Cohnella herbarum TaxID=2728023 RepID=A0A7Z2ZNF6_9BACL|nr:zf-TFIIB domain-containing protein [Cohnella herbarum]QJD86153.1 zf-TFIIB domain-containing protein [Cohnella herbarum]